jgi:hypothetical protein
MSGHTPGPWIVDAYGDVTANGEDVAHVVSYYGVDECIANARLIAAAPEMLAALRGFLAEFGDKTDNNANVRAAREAIAKTEGRA